MGGKPCQGQPFWSFGRHVLGQAIKGYLPLSLPLFQQHLRADHRCQAAILALEVMMGCTRPFLHVCISRAPVLSWLLGSAHHSPCLSRLGSSSKLLQAGGSPRASRASNTRPEDRNFLRVLWAFFSEAQLSSPHGARLDATKYCSWCLSCVLVPADCVWGPGDWTQADLQGKAFL